ncbi:hypothetical protein QN277_021221 [Acacia crassicarpa]|uniref:TF-B3 domain-containing protein n=1 Tax=Acacia crassicarpa TaxID=499986 RepID=A0AAE1KE98_9FABA|nr:hypothetical protein QN277_021221 [Acacia crassicarpa]
MSINHYSPDISEATLWWTEQHRYHHRHHQGFLMQPIQNPSPASAWPSYLCPPAPPNRFNLNHDDDEDEDDDSIQLLQTGHVENDGPTSQGGSGGEDEKEGMFEKPLTPSDVGKLNRLVIPKQHAEKYFPLGGSGGGEAAAGESKGVSLSFEDEAGKCWRFRYSYWNSSQSYVLTKGWSRYVKDKRLDAGDVVFFQRHRTDSNRLFINWRRRHHSPSTPAHVTRATTTDANNTNINTNNNNVGVGVGVGWTRSFYAAHPYPTHHHHQPLPYQPDCLHAGVGLEAEQNKTTTSPPGNNSSSRILRLFGVNMECQPDESGSSGPEYSYMSSMTSSQQGIATQHHRLYGLYNNQTASYYSNHLVRQQPHS